MDGRYFAAYDGSGNATTAKRTATAGWSISTSVSLNYALDLSTSTWTQASILLPNNKGIEQKDSGGVARSVIGITGTDVLQISDGGRNVFLNLGGNSFVTVADNTGHLGGPSNRWLDVTTTTVKLPGSTSGTISLVATATAGTNTITFPAATGTVALTAGAIIPTIAQGDLLYGSAANTLSTLTKDTGISRFVKNSGTSNNPAWAQPAFTDLSGSVAAAQMPALTGDITTSAGAVATTLATVNANVGTFGSSSSIPTFTVNAKGLVTAASGNAVIAPAGTLTGATLAANVLASSLTSVGTIATGVWQGTKVGLAYGGTNADLSATGGASFFLKQNSVGAVITVAQPSAADLSNGTTGSTLVVLQNAPTLIAPILGAATATSLNKYTFTAPATSATLTIADGKTAAHNASTTFAGTDGKTLTISNSGTLSGGDAWTLAIAASKTLTVSNSLTFTGTDGNSFAFPSGSDTVVTLAATQELTNKTLNASVGKGTWTASGTWTLPALTLGGAISGAGNQINNVIIGTTTPLAGFFTTASATTSLTSPLHIGGSGTTGTQLTFQTTTGVGTTDAFVWKRGNNGGTVAATLDNTGLGLGTVAADVLLTINANTAATVAPSLTSIVHLVGADATEAAIHMDTFGAVPRIIPRRANGTLASKAAIASGDVLIAFSPYGWDGSTYVNPANFQFLATEAWTGSARGNAWRVFTTANGSTSILEAIRASGSGGFSVGTTSDPGTGMIYTNAATFMIRSKTSYSNGAGVGVGTLTNAPAATNPTKWIPIDDNGTTRYIPAW